MSADRNPDTASAVGVPSVSAGDPADVDLPAILTNRSRWTWDVIRQGLDEELVIHEETLTEMNLLYVALEGQDLVATYQQSHAEEAVLGADWEWVFYDTGGGQAIFTVIQAKRLDTDDRAYNSLAHMVGDKFQVDLLIRTAEAYGYYPLYAFYNWFGGGSPDRNGCMVASAFRIRDFVYAGQNSLADVLPYSFPWAALLALPPNGSFPDAAAAFLAALDDAAPEELARPRRVPDRMRPHAAGGRPTRPVGLSSRLVVFSSDRA